MQGVYAVLTGDIVGSTIVKDDYQGILHEISFDIEEFVDPGFRFEIFRGDSIQAITKSTNKSLLLAILIRAGFRSKVKEIKSGLVGDIRLAIGLGQVQNDPLDEVSIGVMEGEAFQLSGRLLDSIERKGERLNAVSSKDELNRLFEAVFPMIDDLIQGWSRKQSAAVYWHLLRPNLNQTEIGQKIKSSQRAVSKILVASRIGVIKPFIQYYDSLLS